METFALFADATVSRIVYGFLDPEESPIRLIPIGIGDRQVRHAAENGCFAAFQVLRGLGYIDEGQKYCLSYQFAEYEERIQVLGGSAGLAFCLKFAQQIARQATDHDLSFSIAATGVISNGTAQAEVMRVEGLEAKLQAAITRLQPGDRLFYPSQNTERIAPSLLTAAAENEIELVPVATVAQAISHLLTQIPPQAQLPSEIDIPKAVALDRRAHRMWLPRSLRRSTRLVLMLPLIALLALLLLSFSIDPCHPISQWRLKAGDRLMCVFGVFSPPAPDVLSRRVVEDLIWGRYRQAQRRLQRALQCTEDPDNGVLDLHRQMTQDLRLTIALHHTATIAPPPSGSQAASAEHIVVLGSGDGFQFDITPNDAAFLYVYHVEPRGALMQLFPNAESSPVRNPLAIEQPFRLPRGDQWFILDQNPGLERVYFVASRWPSRDLEAVLERGDGTPPPHLQTQGLGPLMKRLRARAQARACGINGVFYWQYGFR
ncbi:MAG: DUF4384 domain-containing protein, partial [Candidatus Tectomicrobia bacterium]|nr:DUF4384 domain-containing protein [Candidatus Tectomicrobia bacterium]